MQGKLPCLPQKNLHFYVLKLNTDESQASKFNPTSCRITIWTEFTALPGFAYDPGWERVKFWKLKQVNADGLR